jgi:hypothetical protein
VTSCLHGGQPHLAGAGALLVNVNEMLQVIHSPNGRGPSREATSQLENVVVRIESMVSHRPVRAVATASG